MSVVGLDVGNENCIVAVARQRGIDVVLNDESKRETPALVSFNEKQRFIGTAASAAITMNPKNTIAQIKRLVGRSYQDPDVQQELSLFPFRVSESPDGSLVIYVQYLGESRCFTPTQVLGMVLSNLKSIAEKNLQTHVSDCVIGIPIFFSEIQRREVLNAAAIAGIHPLRLMHETTATALAYGIYKTDLPESDPINVVFVDVGHASMQVCVVAFKKGQLKVLGHAFDRSLGGRDFDEVLFNYFCEKFKEEYKIDVRPNPRACQRLRAACEKLKKVLSANPEAPLNIECLMDEKDVRGHMKREDFEKLAHSILDRVGHLCRKALLEAKISADKLYAVEVVGSGSRVPAILKIISSVFNKEPSRTMNASECVARGCTLQCAMLSPTFRVREFEVQDAFPFSISLAWKGSAPESEEGETTEALTTSVVFPKGNSVPSTKMLTFYRATTFSIDVLYTDLEDLPPGTPQKLNTFTIGPFQPSKTEKAKIKVKIRLNLHGIVSVESATMIEEEETEVPVTVSKDSESAMETEREPPTNSSGDADTAKHDTGKATEAENGATADQKPTEMDVDLPKDSSKKKKTKRKDVPVSEHVVRGLPQGELQKAIEKEYEMALQDRVMEETKDKKNAVEAYVYDMRNKLYEKYSEYATDAEKEDLSAKLQDTEYWLYDEGEDETKGVYVAKLAELKKLGDPIEERFKEEQSRAFHVDQMWHCIRSFRDAAKSNDPKFDHIDAADKEKVISECDKAETWLKEKEQQQAVLPKSANPAFLCAEVKKKTETLDRFCKPVMVKPPPPPPKPASPPESSATPKDSEKSAAEGAGQDDAGAAEPMEAENPNSEDAMET
ncbi:hypothetical protein KP509_02G028700 [Ceratopteris richardii]|uniref:Heat shock 70 kDa protein 14 n=1 Tax=Ceratopteris richardii TaxID=49495 RepID=A0A8T2V7T7_CERRI|nr:hypothetical protein KP509_02G028700 [Ceratopteris richardii]KAH7443290.1 hypothetical protein KP509_02G028700 [Ceratopteris richardii]KAH7443291.1 hypothetical protein KP509_02G028700 [Ceratopteris richardii]